jgi:hypothetical protein
MNSASRGTDQVRGEQREKRADCGSVRFSDRDGQLLRLVAEQYTISVEQLARLIGRTHRTGRWLRDRWLRAGWIESGPLTHNGPSFLWLTGEGIRVSQSPYRTWRRNVGMVEHIHAVTEVRLLLEELRLGRWLSERWLASVTRSRAETRPHLPDGLLETGDESIAIEVELTLKSRARLEQIVEELSETYTHVWYFAAARLVPTLSEIAEATRLRNVTVYHYPSSPRELPR